MDAFIAAEIERADADKDGRLNFEEFVRYCTMLRCKDDDWMPPEVASSCKKQEGTVADEEKQLLRLVTPLSEKWLDKPRQILPCICI